ncbi:MAG: hypothetical protein IJI41_03140 [Anaerolineaceae bacterium]|nr:hypothetical protein [Anaerolineaceae bacterium]
MKVIFSDRAYTSVLAETTEKIDTETGGLFLGIMCDDIWYVIEAIDPGPKSVFKVDYFEYDQRYTQHLINKIANLYKYKLDLIGLWHRHPGSLDTFSIVDNGTNIKYASMRDKGAISGLVNVDPIFRLTMYHVNQECEYKYILYDVGDDLIPDSLLDYKSPETYNKLIKSRSLSDPQQDSYVSYKENQSLESFMQFISKSIDEFQINNAEVDLILSEDPVSESLLGMIMDDLSFLVDSLGIEVTIFSENNYLIISQETIEKLTNLSFAYSRNKEQVLLFYNSKFYLYHNRMFEIAAMKVKTQQVDKSTIAKASLQNKNVKGLSIH